jgi:hypothetical protein
VIEACLPRHRTLAAGGPYSGCPECESSLLRFRDPAFRDRPSWIEHRACLGGAAKLWVPACKVTSSETQACKADQRDDRFRIGRTTRSVSCTMRTRLDRDGMGSPFAIGAGWEAAPGRVDAFGDRSPEVLVSRLSSRGPRPAPSFRLGAIRAGALLRLSTRRGTRCAQAMGMIACGHQRLAAQLCGVRVASAPPAISHLSNPGRSPGRLVIADVKDCLSLWSAWVRVCRCTRFVAGRPAVRSCSEPGSWLPRAPRKARATTRSPSVPTRAACWSRSIAEARATRAAVAATAARGSTAPHPAKT